MVHFGEFLKTWSLRSNRVTRQVNSNKTKIGEKRQIWRTRMRHFGWFSNIVKMVFILVLIFFFIFLKVSLHLAVSKKRKEKSGLFVFSFGIILWKMKKIRIEMSNFSSKNSILTKLHFLTYLKFSVKKSKML